MNKGNVVIDKYKLSFSLIIIFFIIFNFIVFSICGSEYETNINIFSIISTFEIVISFIIFKKFFHVFFSPLGFFYIVTVLYSVGQTIGWTLHLNMGEIDLLKYGVNYKYIYLGLIYSLNGILLLFLGFLFGHKNKNNNINEFQTKKNVMDINVLNLLSKFLFVISLPFLIYYWSRILPSIYIGGYTGYYDTMNNFSKIEVLISLVADLFPVSLILLNITSNNKKIKFITIFLLFIYVGITLYIGGRSAAVELMIALFISIQYLGKRINKRGWILLIIVGYLFLSVLNVVADNRNGNNRSIIDTISGFSLKMTDTLGEFIGEMGWQMSSTSWTMEFLENNNKFKYGGSYIISLTSVIPNFGQWDVHPANKINPSNWMQEKLGRTTGLGYSFIAETYYNFSWFGLCLIFLIGFLTSKWLSPINPNNAKYNFKYMSIIVISFATLLKPFVRSTFGAVIHKLFFSLIIIVIGFILIKKLYNKGGKYESRNSNMG